jgi:hypothetical protein
MERLGDDPRRLLAAAGMPETGLLVEIVRVWPEAVGEAVARCAWPARVGRDGTLHIATVSSTWAFELDRLKVQIGERLQAALGSSAPVALRFAPGRVPEAPGETPGTKTPGSGFQAGPEDVAEASRAAAAIGDEALRDLASRAAAAGLARRRSGRRFW